MSGIAELLVNLGYEVSGSDVKRSEVTDRLASSPMIAPPTSWMIDPPGAIAFAPSTITGPFMRPPIASMISPKVRCM